ncbi:MAG TPA: transposase, partial [candidate division Zixibacteria bacterium]|nr:transposase [candidate division Zixibacteria bacterium]
MSKLRRYTTTNAIFFVTAVTHNRTPHLSRHADTFREALRRQSGAHSAIIHAWVALPDHFHLLIELQKTPLDKFMHALKLSFSSLLSRKLGRPAGRVWQHRYWD